MNSRSEARRDVDTETLILQAAEREFMAKGFLGARTTSIAEAAGVTHAMLHYYFRTKEKLFDRIVSEKVNLLKNAMADALGDMDAPLSVVVRNIIDGHLEFIAANPDLPHFLIGEIFSNPQRSEVFLERLREFTPSLLALIQDKIDHEAGQGRCRKLDARALMLDIVSLNVFPYVAFPAVNAALGDCMADAAAFLEMRKQENYDTIMRKLSL